MLYASAVGEAGNFCHHRILASLRANDGDTKYVPPSGGLFDLVAAPHYFFELVAWWGIGMVAVRFHSCHPCKHSYAIDEFECPRRHEQICEFASMHLTLNDTCEQMHWNALLVAASMTSYLGGRSVAQNRWNRQKFGADGWPESRKNLIPYVF